MSGTEEETASPGWLGGSSQLADWSRWSDLAVEASVDLRTMQDAARAVRAEFAGFDLGTSMRVLAALAGGAHAFARLVQADLEAVRTLEAAGADVPDEVLVQFPREPGAVRAATGSDGTTWFLDGVQHRTVHPAAAGSALVAATTADGERMFLVDLDRPGVVRDRGPLRTIAPQDPNGPVAFTAVVATPVGSAAWWAGRRESFDGLLRDAACWFGSCVWLCRAVESTLSARSDPNDLVRAGRVDVWVFSARLAMRDAAVVVELDPTGREAELAARRAVAVAATTVDTVIRLVALLSDARMASEDGQLPSRVAQLQIALRRFDTEANLRALGTLAAGVEPVPADGR